MKNDLVVLTTEQWEDMCDVVAALKAVLMRECETEKLEFVEDLMHEIIQSQAHVYAVEGDVSVGQIEFEFDDEEGGEGSGSLH